MQGRQAAAQPTAKHLSTADPEPCRIEIQCKPLQRYRRNANPKSSSPFPKCPTAPNTQAAVQIGTEPEQHGCRNQVAEWRPSLLRPSAMLGGLSLTSAAHMAHSTSAMKRAGLFSETNSRVAMTVQIDPWLSAKPRTNPSTPSRATLAQVSLLASARPELGNTHKEFVHPDTISIFQPDGFGCPTFYKQTASSSRSDRVDGGAIGQPHSRH